MNGTIYTQTRYGSQFVSSPFSALLSVLSKECRVLFIQTIQSSIYFFPSSLFLLGLLFGLKGRVKTKPPIRICLHNGDVVETQCNNTDRLLIFRNFSIIFIEFGLSNRMFFSLLKKKNLCEEEPIKFIVYRSVGPLVAYPGCFCIQTIRII